MNRSTRNAVPLDGGLVSAAAILVASGIVMIYSATAALALDRAIPPHFLRHLAAVVVGVALAAAVSRVPIAVWRNLAVPLWVGSLVLLALTLVAGVTVNGAQRWLEIPGLGVRFQPAEIAKWTTLLATAAILSQRESRTAVSPRQWILASVLGVLPAALLVMQPDMGSAAMIVLLVGLLLFVGGAPPKSLIIPALASVVGLLAYVLRNPYAWARLVGFRDPWLRSDAEGFQLVQSFVAFGRGGLFGVGIGDGRQKLFYLPEAHNDFILSVVAEEVGLVGVLIVLGAFAALLVAGTRVALAARHRFTLLLATGMTSLLTAPAIINAAVVMGLVPTKGLALPFLSYGRTALVVSFLALGLLLSIGRSERRQVGSVGRAEPRGLRQTRRRV